MIEQHRREQYFFDAPTADHLAGFVRTYPNPCCVCAPLVGEALARRGVAATILDVDERFARLPGFRVYDIYRPEWLGETFGLILCDPPFFKVSLSQLFAALRVLSQYQTNQPGLVAYLVRRSLNLMSTFHPFSLQPTGYHPGYLTVQATDRNDIEFYGNLGDEAHARLRGDHV